VIKTHTQECPVTNISNAVLSRHDLQYQSSCSFLHQEISDQHLRNENNIKLTRFVQKINTEVLHTPWLILVVF